MRRPYLHGALPTIVGLCLAVALCSCERLRVPPKLADIEWVIVDCHKVGVDRSWIAKLAPRTHSRLIKGIIAAINHARRGDPTKTSGESFILFKMKGRGIQTFNFVTWGEERAQVEIKPCFFSSRLVRLLKTIEEQKIGWKTDDLFPEMRVREIEVREYGRPPRAFRQDSPLFAPLLSATREILNAFDPRVCIERLFQGDPAKVSCYEGSTQLILWLEEPVEMCRLTVEWRWRKGPCIKYVSFPSSVFAVFVDLDAERGDLPYISCMSGRRNGKWYTWDIWEMAEFARTMGKPNLEEAFMKFLEVYQKVSPQLL